MMKTKRPMEDEETEAKRPRVEAEPKNTINSDIDMDEELKKLKMQSWNFMSMVKGFDVLREKDRQRFIRELGSRSTPNVVMNFMTKNTRSKQRRRGFFVHVQDWIGVQWGSTDDPACPRAGISDHEA